MNADEFPASLEPTTPVEPIPSVVNLQPVIERLDCLEQTVARLEQLVGALGERLGLIPAQLRQLGSKVDDVTENINQSRLHDLLQSLLLLHDLTGQFAATADPENAHNYRLLRQQILETLEINGIYPIAAAGHFDPTCHKIVERIPCASPEEDGQIASVYRPGFRTERTVLRYAEVMVRFFEPARQNSAE